MAEVDLEELLGRDLFGRIQRAAWTATEIDEHERVARIESRRALLEHSGVIRVLTAAGLDVILHDRCERTVSLRQVELWLFRAPVLGLFGPTDAGKTVAAAWALARYPGRYHELAELAELRRAARAKGGKHARAWRSALDAQLLVLDELGAEDDAGAAASALHEAVNLRLRNKRTLLLGNIDRATWESRYDARTTSRLDEVGKLFGVPPTGLRKKNGESL